MQHGPVVLTVQECRLRWKAQALRRAIEAASRPAMVYIYIYIYICVCIYMYEMHLCCCQECRAAECSLQAGAWKSAWLQQGCCCSQGWRAQCACQGMRQP